MIGFKTKRKVLTFLSVCLLFIASLGLFSCKKEQKPTVELYGFEVQETLSVKYGERVSIPLPIVQDGDGNVLDVHCEVRDKENGSVYLENGSFMATDLTGYTIRYLVKSNQNTLHEQKTEVTVKSQSGELARVPQLEGEVEVFDENWATIREAEGKDTYGWSLTDTSASGLKDRYGREGTFLTKEGVPDSDTPLYIIPAGDRAYYEGLVDKGYTHVSVWVYLDCDIAMDAYEYAYPLFAIRGTYVKKEATLNTNGWTELKFSLTKEYSATNGCFLDAVDYFRNGWFMYKIALYWDGATQSNIYPGAYTLYVDSVYAVKDSGLTNKVENVTYDLGAKLDVNSLVNIPEGVQTQTVVSFNGASEVVTGEYTFNEFGEYEVKVVPENNRSGIVSVTVDVRDTHTHLIDVDGLTSVDLKSKLSAEARAVIDGHTGETLQWTLTQEDKAATQTALTSSTVTIADLPVLCAYTLTVETDDGLIYKGTFDFYDEKDGLIYQSMDEVMLDYTVVSCYSYGQGGLHCIDGTMELTNDGLTVAFEHPRGSWTYMGVRMAPLHSKAYYQLWLDQGLYGGIDIPISNLTSGGRISVLNGESEWLNASKEKALTLSLQTVIDEYETLCKLSKKLTDKESMMEYALISFEELWAHSAAAGKSVASAKIGAFEAAAATLADTTTYLVDVKELTTYDLQANLSDEGVAFVEKWATKGALDWKLTPSYVGATAIDLTDMTVTVSTLPMLCSYELSAWYGDMQMYSGIVDFYDSADGMVYNVLDENLPRWTRGLSYNNASYSVYVLSEATYADGVLSAPVQKNWGNTRSTIMVAPMHSKAYYEFWQEQGTYEGFKLTISGVGNFYDYTNINGSGAPYVSGEKTIEYSLANIIEKYDGLCDITLLKGNTTTDRFFNYLWPACEKLCVTGIKSQMVKTTGEATLVDVKELTTYDLTSAISEETMQTLDSYAAQGNLVWTITAGYPTATPTVLQSTTVTIAELPMLCSYTVKATFGEHDVYIATYDFYNSTDGMVYNVFDENITLWSRTLNYNNGNVGDKSVGETVYASGALTGTVVANWGNTRTTILIAPMHSKAYYEFWQERGGYTGISFTVAANKGANFTEGASTANGSWVSANTETAVTYSLADIIANYDELCDVTLTGGRNTLAKFFSYLWLTTDKEVTINDFQSVVAD